MTLLFIALSKILQFILHKRFRYNIGIQLHNNMLWHLQVV